MPRLLRGVDLDRGRALVPSRIETHDGHVSHGVAVLEVRAVDRLGEDPGERRLAGPARPDEQDGVGDPVGRGRRCGASRRRLPGRRSRRRSGPASGGRAPGAGRSRSRRSCGHGQDGLRGRLPCTLRRPGRSRAHRDERLGPGRSAAPDDDRLVLLPSGPDTVRGSPLRGTRSSTSHRRAAFENGDLGREFSPAGADCRYRAPLVPRLARLGKDTRSAVAIDGRVRGRAAPGARSVEPLRSRTAATVVERATPRVGRARDAEWRRGRDSNPRRVAPNRISSAAP